MSDDTDKQTAENGSDERGEAGRFATGNAGGPGRPKGGTNRIGADLKTDLWDAYQQRGGRKWLETLPPKVFAGLLVKLLPRDERLEVATRDYQIKIISFADYQADQRAQLGAPADGEDPTPRLP